MVGGTVWPVLGIQPPNYNEHATQLIAEATALLELDSSKRGKLRAQTFDAFLNSIVTFAKRSREQPSTREILTKLNELQPIVEDITLIKNAVNHAASSPNAPVASSAARVATWADLVRSGTPSYPSTPGSRPSTNTSTQDRETLVKLDAKAASNLRTAKPDEIQKRVNEALSSRISLLGKAPRVIAAEQCHLPSVPDCWLKLNALRDVFSASAANTRRNRNIFIPSRVSETVNHPSSSHTHMQDRDIHIIETAQTGH
ncbi:hypothetical protein AJ79_10120 [Helicocarpus griseus UAMH5409]|uniref:Uncharacterized protein n=1 Tax=Helicocarpus griseus UAMH5409 TaxID=1447875 RepID=A0A2B7WFC4_9EURO|nr:hypothetical protein AJ79_10120 [Helicocarpus griseus UAMH5409]